MGMWRSGEIGASRQHKMKHNHPDVIGGRLSHSGVEVCYFLVPWDRSVVS